MPAWAFFLEAVVALAVFALLYIGWLVIRRRILARHGGTFEMSLRLHLRRPGRGWALGTGRYVHDHLQWFRVFSLVPRASHTWHRRDLELIERRAPRENERHTLYADHVVVVCDGPHGEIEMAMAESSVTGFQAWLEGGPPDAVQLH